MSNINPLDMTDEDFAKSPIPETQEKTPEPAPVKEETAEEPSKEETEEETNADTSSGSDTDSDDTDKSSEDTSKPEADKPDSEYVTPPSGSEKPKDTPEKEGEAKPKVEPEADKPASAEKPAPKDGKPEDKPAEKAEPVNYEEFYKTIMKPFKANGREITLQSPDEAIRLMQMGAGFGRKLHDMQPHLKKLRMLEKNNINDESELSYLIDLHQKNPDAIKKLIKDSGIDPLDLNMEDNANYVPKDHTVSDKEINFKNQVESIGSTPEGQKTLLEVNKWDTTSKNILWESPELLEVIQSQREAGIYDQINAEIDRQKTLGYIPAGTPFLNAYKIAGDSLQKAGAFVPKATDSQTEDKAPKPAVLEVRAAAPKPSVANNEKAKAASSTQASSKKASVKFNPLELADDEFLKQMGNRL